jgi:hypothetical protein
MSVKTPGRNPETVKPRENLTRVPREAQALHLKITSDAHQKLATLSSNMPRLNGKIRVIGPRMVEEGEKGGRNGRKSMRKAKRVAKAKRINRRELNRN